VQITLGFELMLEPPICNNFRVACLQPNFEEGDTKQYPNMTRIGVHELPESRGDHDKGV